MTPHTEDSVLDLLRKETGENVSVEGENEDAVQNEHLFHALYALLDTLVAVDVWPSRFEKRRKGRNVFFKKMCFFGWEVSTKLKFFLLVIAHLHYLIT